MVLVSQAPTRYKVGFLQEDLKFTFAPTIRDLPMSSHLSNDVEIEGTLHCTEDLVFEGTMKGDIVSKGTVRLGTTADVQGKLSAETAHIEGSLDGAADLKKCRVVSGASLKGQLKITDLHFEEGAALNGDCEFGS
jgi:cytoskeletal protein CcmA (bactofilin family)